jgi:hypothetical protein
MRERISLPSPLPAGTKYVIECRGKKKGSILMHRHVELPDGQRVELAPRLVPISRTSPKTSTRVRCARRNAGPVNLPGYLYGEGLSVAALGFPRASTVATSP